MIPTPHPETARFSPCGLCDAAFHGLIREKIEIAQRLKEMERNHDGALRLYSEWRSRADKAEVAHAELLEALRDFMSYGCPVCGGDCAAANPPVSSCPVQAGLAAIAKAERRS